MIVAVLTIGGPPVLTGWLVGQMAADVGRPVGLYAALATSLTHMLIAFHSHRGPTDDQ